MLQAGRTRAADPMRLMNVLKVLNPSIRTRPRSLLRHRNEYQEQKRMILGNEARPARRLTPHRHL
jgi:hypothetical protein